jgi:uncharacterized protein
VKALCVVVHDVAPATWAATRRLLDALAEVGNIPVTLLAVPRYHGEERDHEFERWLIDRAAKHGDEIALHGYRHVEDGQPRGWVDRLIRQSYTRGEGEFADLPFDEASRRIDMGLTWLRELGVRPAGFVAPAWLLGPHAWRAVCAHAFDYTCTLRHIHLLRADLRADPLADPHQARVIDCQAQVYSHSKAWRRGMSVVWNESLARLQRGRPLVRLELHPADVDHPMLKATWHRLARTQLASRTACTLQALVRAAEREISEKHQDRSGSEPTDRRTHDHVAGIVQAEHDA